jgi:hypothetical protein
MMMNDDIDITEVHLHVTVNVCISTYACSVYSIFVDDIDHEQMYDMILK